MFVFILVSVAAFGLALLLAKRKYSYWRLAGFDELKPLIPFGCMLPFVKKQRSALLTIADTYHRLSKPFFGIYIFWMPQLMVKDLRLVRRILIDDFEYFHDRDAFIDEVHDPISVNVFSQRGQKWKKMRYDFSKLFTTNNLKTIFEHLDKEMGKMERRFEEFARAKEKIKLKLVIANHSINFIASVFYGLEIDTVSDPSHKFYQLFLDIGHPAGFLDVMRQASSFFFPQPLHLFGMRSMPKNVRDCLIDTVRIVINDREARNIRRNDMLQVLIDQRKSGTNSGLTVEEIAGNLFIFFFAGNETATNAASYCFYEFCRNPRVYKKAQEAVKKTLQNHNNTFCFEAVREVNYLDLCVKEVRRKYTGFATLNRLTAKDYKVPGYDGVVWKKGTTVLLPYGPMHMDPKYFPKPMEFMPERFEEGSGMANTDAFFPFGAGPRHCLAFRMGLMHTKAIMMTILAKFELELTNKEELGFDNAALELVHKKPITVTCKLKRN